MARKLKTDLWKKAYLIEFTDESNTLLEAFTFSVPPESEELTYSQRKTETKTFGGLHVDDYGIDAVKITLSGSTINQDLKRIYNPAKPGVADDDRSYKSDTWLTGEQEIYRLRDLLKKYKSGEWRDKNVKILLYDLSKIDYMRQNNIVKNYWRVFPGDFKIRRAADRPFTYKYTIEFTGIDMDEGEYDQNVLAPKLGIAAAAVKAIGKAVTTLEKGMKYVDSVTALLDDLKASINDVLDCIEELSGALAGYLDGFAEWFDAANDLLKIPVDITTRVSNIKLKFMNSGQKLRNSVEAMAGIITSYTATGGSGGGDSGGAPQEALDEYNMTAAEYADSWAGLCAGLEDNANTVVAVSKSNNIPTITVGGNGDSGNGDSGNGDSGNGDSGNGDSGNGDSGNGDSGNGDSGNGDSGNGDSGNGDSGNGDSGNGDSGNGDSGNGDSGNGDSGNGDSGNGDSGNGDSGRVAHTARSAIRQNIVLSYGDISVVLKSTDSLESLATQYYGSPDKAVDIATYNGVASVNELNPGDTIKIPILTLSSRHLYNRIFSRPEDRDNYGRDILLDNEGYTRASTSGDYELTEGVNNLNQAILLRIRERVNKRIRLIAYGIKNNINDTTAGVAYILSSIDLTVRAEPRVNEIEGIQFYGMGDGLNVNVYYTDVNNASGNAAGSA